MPSRDQVGRGARDACAAYRADALPAPVRARAGQEDDQNLVDVDDDDVRAYLPHLRARQDRYRLRRNPDDDPSQAEAARRPDAARAVPVQDAAARAPDHVRRVSSVWHLPRRTLSVQCDRNPNGQPAKPQCASRDRRYLAHKHRGLVVACGVLRRRAIAIADAAVDAENENGGGGGVGMVFRYGAAHASKGTQLFLVVLGLLLLLPEEGQILLIDNLLGCATVLVILFIKVQIFWRPDKKQCRYSLEHRDS